MSRHFGAATPPDGAGPLGPDEHWPQKAVITWEQFTQGLNPLHYVPVVGNIYRAITGEPSPPIPMRVAASGITGGPLGMIGTALLGLVEQLIEMGPDTSRPSAPAGMSATGSEQGVQTVSPGTLAEGQYTTLATSQPEWLGGPTRFAAAVGAYQTAEHEWRRAEMVEKGLG